MCGRYNLVTDRKTLISFFRVDRPLLGEFEPRYNIAPSQYVPAIRQGDAGRELVALKWGLVPFWAKDPKIGYHTINARAETVATKPAFREAFKRRRCLIPATGFYEWSATTTGKRPYHIAMRDHSMFAFAGLWECWRKDTDQLIESCSIIVTTANDDIRPIHDRMPVILHTEDFGQWLDPHTLSTARLQTLLQPYPAGEMSSYPVGLAVNNPRNDRPECLQALMQDNDVSR